MNRNENKNKGFTVIELIVAMALIAILITGVVLLISKYIDNAKLANRNSIVRTTYAAAAAYGVREQLTSSINPSAELLQPYISSDVKIVSGKGEHNCNEYGHFVWDNYTGSDKDELMCVHIIVEGRKYDAAGLTSPVTKKTIVIEMYDETVDRQFNEKSEKNIRYFVFEV